ncbi:MAG: M24 family metallopeptidase, partial [Kiritimatiellia bacterium]
AQVPGCEVLVGGAHAHIKAILRRQRYRGGLGVQGRGLTWSAYRVLHEALGKRKVIDIGDLISTVRAIKDEAEVVAIRRCVSIAQRAYRALIAEGVGYLMGHTESELAAELEYRMRMLGADRQAFPGGIIVASGPNSASCHHEPTRRKPRQGEPLLFDWGAEWGGYRSDITRVVFMGTPSEKMQHVYAVVEKANAAGVAAIRAGVSCDRVAKAGWNVVKDAGYGELIRHGLGHGIGLDVHELPGLGAGGSQSSSGGARLRAGMVVTIEPGVYVDGFGGVRIEDDVLVRPSGRTVLTSLPRSLRNAIL